MKIKERKFLPVEILWKGLQGHTMQEVPSGIYMYGTKNTRPNEDIFLEVVKFAYQIGRRVIDPKRACEIIGINQNNAT